MMLRRERLTLAFQALDASLVQTIALDRVPP